MARRSIGVWLALWLPASIGVHAGAFAWAMHERASTAADPALEIPRSNAVLTGGETFDIDPEGDFGSESETAPSTANATEAAEPGDGQRNVPRHASKHAAVGKAASSNPGAATAVFGAEGDRSAVDLARAFAHTFPQIASADPVWATVALGSSGAFDVSLEIADDGSLVRSNVQGSGSAALRRSVERTLALLEHRTFTAHARTTSLRVSVSVSTNAVNDGLHGNVFALGGDFDHGDVFFALAIGRRVDISIVPR